MKQFPLHGQGMLRLVTQLKPLKGPVDSIKIQFFKLIYSLEHSGATVLAKTSLVRIAEFFNLAEISNCVLINISLDINNNILYSN